MVLSVRKADLKADKQVIIETLLHYLTPASNEERFDWLYTKNPFGHALAWLGVDEENGTVFGVASAFPRRVFVNGKIEGGWVLGDFCIHDQYRSLGPAIKLQKTCLADLRARNSRIWYDFPSVSMMAVYQRLREPIVQHDMLRLAKPIRVDRKIQHYINVPVLTGVTTYIANVCLRLLQKPKFHKEEGVTVGICVDEYGEEFSRLASEVGQKQDVCLERSASYLNWRYFRNPLCRYELITARKGRSLRAYAVCRWVGEDMTVVDMFGYEEMPVIRALLAYITERCRDQGMMTLSIPMIDSHPWRSHFQQLGFQVRDSCPLVLGGNGLSRSDGSGRWFVAEGDRDG